MDLWWIGILLCGIAGYVGARLGVRSERRRFRVIADAEVSSCRRALEVETKRHLGELRAAKAELREASWSPIVGRGQPTGGA